MKKSIINPELAREDGKNYENRIPMSYWAEDDLPSQNSCSRATAACLTPKSTAKINH
jgi:hypothetical protein